MNIFKAHVAGIAGHILRSDYGLENKLGRITGTHISMHSYLCIFNTLMHNN